MNTIFYLVLKLKILISLFMDRYIIDSNSLINYARYYIPFDENNLKIIEDFFNKEILLLHEAVLQEVATVAKSIVVERMPFIQDLKDLKIKNDYPITKKQHRLIDHTWYTKGQKRRLSDKEIQDRKSKFIESADAQMILFIMNLTEKDDKELFKSLDNYSIITEETRISNDNKLFKKIPLICDQQKINCITLPDFLQQQNIKIKMEK